MKILKLTFKNLNSLYGEWSIDFTHPEYVSNGIFALTGPTGAGKSTILDAITLALYGQTPRLGRITTSSNEIMSRQTTNCSSEVEFTSSHGHFICTWEQHRARNKVDGNLVDASHEISDATTGILIESKRSLVPSSVEEKTGMDFDRFTRSVLLAQGSFDTFLKAGAEEKSKILEQITGTEMYTIISKAVFDKHKGENEILTRLKDLLEEIKPISKEAELEYKEKISAYEAQEKGIKETLQTHNNALNWLLNIKKIEEELTLYHQMQHQLSSELDEFHPKREILSRALKANELARVYSEITQLREAMLSNEKYIKETTTTVNSLYLTQKEKEDESKEKETHTIHTKEEEKNQRTIIKQVRSLDQKIHSQSQSITKEKNSRNIIKTTNIELSKEIEIAKKQLQEKTSMLTHIEHFLQEHSQDDLLNTSLSGIEAILDTLSGYKTKIAIKEKDSTTLQKDIKSQQSHIDVLTITSLKQEKSFKELQETIKIKKEEITSLLDGKLLREYYKDKDSLIEIKSLHTKIQDLAHERSLLIDGTPCPLCGSLDHPYAKGNIPIKNDIDRSIETITTLITTIETKQDHINELEADEKREEKLVSGHIESIKNASNTLDRSNNQRTSLVKDIKDQREEYESKKEILMKSLSGVGIEDIKNVEELTLLSTLKERLTLYNKHTNDKNALTKEIENITHSKEQKEHTYTTNESRINEISLEIESLETEYNKDKNTRKELFQDKDCDEQEKKLLDAIEKAEGEEKRVKELLTSINTDLHTLNENLKATNKKRETDRPNLTTKESSFIESLNLFSFKDEQEFILSRLSLDQREEINTTMKQLDNRKTTIEANIESRTNSLKIEKEKKETDESLEEISDTVSTLTSELTKIVEEKATITTTLNQNETIKLKGLEKQKEIDARSKIVAKYSRLNTLIGSSDGKKYRKFAQGITFELMVDHANQQLHKMSDRYLLLHSSAEPLELHIIDNYQAGEIRSIKNLSGGESFIVSLALALGLSQMSSKKVQVDSLFLDEGFGTLDEQSLETALETLSTLQQTGKLIGIISHVAGLKERISTQIQVNPINGGKSSIEGPGVKSIIDTK